MKRATRQSSSVCYAWADADSPVGSEYESSQTWIPPLRPSQQARFGWSRVDAFLDAVYAIAATLLVLELRPPKAEAGDLAAALIDQWPTYLVYTLGFIQIVGGWGVLRRISAWSRGLDHYAMMSHLCPRFCPRRHYAE